jgi:hypothetical protein
MIGDQRVFFVRVELEMFAAYWVAFGRALVRVEVRTGVVGILDLINGRSDVR